MCFTIVSPDLFQQCAWSVSDHCSNVAVGIIDLSEHTMNAHEVIKNIKKGNAHYSDKYSEYLGKYAVAKLV